MYLHEVGLNSATLLRVKKPARFIAPVFVFCESIMGA